MTDARPPPARLTVEGTGHSGRSMAGLAQPGCGWPVVIGNCGSARAWAGAPIGWAPPSIAPANEARNLGSFPSLLARSCWPRLGRSQEGVPLPACLPTLGKEVRNTVLLVGDREMCVPAGARAGFLLGFVGWVRCVGWILPAPPGRALVFHAIIQENRLMRCSETCVAPYRSASRP